MLSADDNKAIVRRFYEELWNERRVEIADEIIAADCLTHQLSAGAVDVKGVPRTPEMIREHVAAWLAGFPDLHFTIEQMFAEGDHVVTHSRMRATHTGAWQGIAATGRTVSLPMIVIQRISGGKIAEDWVLVESLGFYQQLGFLPATEEIIARAVE
ncbi:MAG TPA: ester cyclase [Pyrinomonadaceae bacterium]|nr:ester cyclase [Pyrinomonadaceae bacterium]